MLKMGMGGGSGPPGKQPVETTISGVGPPLGATKGYDPYGSTVHMDARGPKKRVQKSIQKSTQNRPWMFCDYEITMHQYM